jgi:hypothetical protein
MTQGEEALLRNALHAQSRQYMIQIPTWVPSRYGQTCYYTDTTP